MCGSSLQYHIHACIHIIYICTVGIDQSYMVTSVRAQSKYHISQYVRFPVYGTHMKKISYSDPHNIYVVQV